MKSYKYRVQGRVQGVFYRASIQEAAQEKGFSGYVQNLPDGSVEAGVSCADERECQEFEAILHQGSKLSRVDRVACEAVEDLFSGGFEIKR
ncbi:MAG: acylphosphatase [Campylobacterota bacterium]